MIFTGQKEIATFIRPRKLWFSIDFHGLWQYRELVYFLAWRDVKIRYKQTVLGVLWVVLQPVTYMMVFNLIFHRFMKIPSTGIPYNVFVYAGLLPWSFFSSTLSRSSISLIGNTHLITKVYFPRMIIPISSALSSFVDFLVSFPILIGFMFYYGFVPTWSLIYLPFFVFLTIFVALGVGMWLSSLNAKYRDVNYIAPFLIQIWMYLTPIIYDSSFIPSSFRKWLSLNPMTSVIEGFRWALFGTVLVAPTLMASSIITACVILISGVIYFNHVEKTIADFI